MFVNPPLESPSEEIRLISHYLNLIFERLDPSSGFLFQQAPLSHKGQLQRINYYIYIKKTSFFAGFWPTQIRLFCLEGDQYLIKLEGGIPFSLSVKLAVALYVIG